MDYWRPRAPHLTSTIHSNKHWTEQKSMCRTNLHWCYCRENFTQAKEGTMNLFIFVCFPSSMLLPLNTFFVTCFTFYFFFLFLNCWWKLFGDARVGHQLWQKKKNEWVSSYHYHSSISGHTKFKCWKSASGFRNMSSAFCISCYLFIRYMCGLPVVSGGLTKVIFYI